MEERVDCRRCGASILPATAQRYDGICKPCYKQELYDRIGQSPFGKAYDGFSKGLGLKSSRFFDLWLNFNHLLGSLLFHIRTEGHCDHVFRKREGQLLYFDGVADFNRWGLSLIEEFRTAVRATMVRAEKAKKDRRTLLRKADEAVMLLTLAVRLLEGREKN
ncbi:MAG TPA: hypothetical protein VFD58_07715 [Blastocatellia bacterium]|nr:hypothetical protein [Blastocatellia bacterium]